MLLLVVLPIEISTLLKIDALVHSKVWRLSLQKTKALIGVGELLTHIPLFGLHGEIGKLSGGLCDGSKACSSPRGFGLQVVLRHRWRRI